MQSQQQQEAPSQQNQDGDVAAVTAAATGQHIQTLQSQANTLASQLKEAIDNAAKSEQKLKDYDARVESM